MLSQPLTLNESVITGRDLSDVASPPILPLVDEDDEQTGVVSPPAAPPRCSTSVSSPPTPPCASTSSTDTCLTPMPTPLPPPLPLCPHPVSFHTSSLSPHPFSSAPSPTPSYSTSSTPPMSSHSAPFSVSSTSSTSLHDAPLPPSLYDPSPCLVSLPQPPPASAAFLTPHPSTSSSLSSSSVPPSLTAQPPAVSPLLPPPPPPCCPCASLLPRLLSAHRLEVRRLLRGALASLGRRLDSLERRSRRRRKKGQAHQRGRGACSSTSPSCSSTPIPPVTSPPSSLSSSASESEDSSTPPRSSCFLLSESDQRNRRQRSEDKEEEELRGRKRRRKNRREDFNFTGNRVADQEEDSGRFVGRMLVSFRGGGTEDEAPLTLHNFNHRKHMTTDQAAARSQSEKAVSTITKQNGYRKHLLMHNVSTSSYDSLHRVQTCSQPEVLDVSNGQWSFSAFTPPLSFSPNHSALRLWLCSSSSSINPALMLRMSTVAVETVSESVRGEAYECPLRPLKDWTAPPSLKSDHCYIQTSAPSPTFSARRQQKQRSNHSTRSLHLPRRRPLPLPPCPANGLSTPFPASQSTASAEFSSTSGECVKRVSQIRIRRASPRETPLTPMGLPKIKRLKKKEFSLEEIYTNKNYKSPTTNRSLETIYEEPREKDGALLLIGQQRRRRLLLFPDFTQPRKRKRPQGAGFPVVMAPRKRAAARRHCHGNSDDDADLDVMLVERLSALEDFLTRQGLDV